MAGPRPLRGAGLELPSMPHWQAWLPRARDPSSGTASCLQKGPVPALLLCRPCLEILQTF